MKWYILVPLVLVVVASLVWYLTPREEVSITVEDITINNAYITRSNIVLDFTVNVLVHNPHPFDVYITRLTYDIYAVNSEDKFLGHGQRENIVIRRSTTSEVSIPIHLTPDYATLGDLFVSAMSKGTIKIKVKGTVFVNVKLTTLKKDFEVTKEVPLA